MNILILGSGGREHALAWAVKQNPKCDRLIVWEVAPEGAVVALLGAGHQDFGAVIELRNAARGGQIHQGHLVEVEVSAIEPLKNTYRRTLENFLP